MQISLNSFMPFVQNNNNKVKSQSNIDVKNHQNTRLMSYPSNYYIPISFGRISNETIVKNIGLENFPSPQIAKIILNNPQKTLYDAHTKHYAPLLECETLDEAKKLYPEFEGVIDAKDINVEELPHTNTIYKISRGKIEGANLETLSLDLLKKYYGKVLSPNDKENYYGLGGIKKILLNLKINVFNRGYGVALSKQKPENIENVRQKYDENTEAGLQARENLRQKGIQRYDKSTEAGLQARENLRQKGIQQFDENTEAGRQAREYAKQRSIDYNNSINGYMQNLSRQLSWYFNPENRYGMSLEAKNTPNFPELLKKEKNGTITKDEKNMLNGYLKNCEKAMPGHKKEIIGPIEKLINSDLKTRMQKAKEGSATDEDLTILSSYYLLTKAKALQEPQKPCYLDCFSDIEETLLKNEDTYNKAVNMMSDYFKHIQKKYPDEIIDQYFLGLKAVLEEEIGKNK